MADQCAGCENTGAELKRCAACKTIFYCSRSCQRSDWPNHKHTCRLLRDKTPKPKPNDICSVIDFSTGTIKPVNPNAVCDPKILKLRAPKPQPKELPDLAIKLNSAIAAKTIKKFFPRVRDQPFEFITDFRGVVPEWAAAFVDDGGDVRTTVLLAKITQMEVWQVRHGIRLMDGVNQNSTMAHFYLSDDNPLPFFKWEHLKPGHYFCYQAPLVHTFSDGQVGFRINNAWQIRILDKSGEVLSGY